jgi:hypothetical protein
MGFVLDPTCLTAVGDVASSYDWVYPYLSPGGALWSGESAIHTNGGSPPDTDDTFRSSFYYIEQLGSISSRGNSVAARQTLTGGEYALLNRTSFQPFPDYWILTAFRHLATKASIRVVPNPSNETGALLRAYGHCAQGGGRLVEISNINTNASVVVRLNFTHTDTLDQVLEVYMFSGSLYIPGIPVNINGRPWTGGNETTLRPLPEPIRIPCCQLKIPAASIAFVVAPFATC